MSLESGTYISDLVPTNPTPSDPKSQGDDHLRLIKETIKNTFPNINGPVTKTDEELNSPSGGASGGGTDRVFYNNDQIVTTNYAIPTGQNSVSAGKITVADGIIVTVPDGSAWTVV